MRHWSVRALLLGVLALSAASPTRAQQTSEDDVRAALDAQREAMRSLARELQRAAAATRPSRDSVVARVSAKLQQLATELDRTNTRVLRLSAEDQAELRREFSRVVAEFRDVAMRQRALLIDNVSVSTRPRGRLGVTLSGTQSLTVDDGTVRTFYRTMPVITSVEPGSPANAAGCEAGDTILAMGGVSLPGEVSLTELLVPGRRVPLRLRRNGNERTVNVTVGAAPEVRVTFIPSPAALPGFPSATAAPSAPAAVATPHTPRTPVTPRPPSTCGQGGPCSASGAVNVTGSAYSPYASYSTDTWSVAGAEMTVVTDDLEDVVGRSDGILLLRVAPGSPAQSSGLRGGDVVFQVGDEEVESPRELQRLLMRASSRGEKSLVLRVSRQRRERTVTLRW